MKNKAVISHWQKGFNGLKDGERLEGIVSKSELNLFLATIHYGDENISIMDTDLPVTHIGTEDGFFRRI